MDIVVQIYFPFKPELFKNRKSQKNCFFHQHRKILSTTGSILLSEHNHLELIITGENTSTGNGTEDVGTGTLEEGLGSLVLKDDAKCLHRALVLHGFTRGHHHSSADRVYRVRCKPGPVGDYPTESEASKETILK